MTKRFEFKLKYTDIGYCRAVFTRDVILKNGDEHSFVYCIMDGQVFTMTPDWEEPISPLSAEAVKSSCYFQRVPEGDPMAQEANEFIQAYTAGFLEDSHEFKRHDLRE